MNNKSESKMRNKKIEENSEVKKKKGMINQWQQRSTASREKTQGRTGILLAQTAGKVGGESEVAEVHRLICFQTAPIITPSRSAGENNFWWYSSRKYYRE